jgi:hypothetical protein
VIQRNTMEFLAPIPADFTATAQLRDPASWGRFEQMLRRKGRARIAASATLHCAKVEAGRFEGEFVAILRDAETAD